MSESENPDLPPLEPEGDLPAQAVGDSTAPVDVEILQILVSPPGQEGAVPELPAASEVSSVIPSAPFGAPAGESERLVQLVQGLGERLDGRLAALQTLFEREQRAEAARERVVDRLHAELQEYKQDLLLKIQRPIFIDLIQLHDDIGKIIEARATESAGNQEPGTLRGILESIQTAIEDILYRQGVEPFMSEGTDFDPRKQRAVSTVLTGDPALGKTVAARLRKGYQAGDKVIRPEVVTVYTLRPNRTLGSQEG